MNPKVLVTQGHERGIGLEVFLKSFLLLTSLEQNQIILICFKSTLEENLKFLKIPYHIKDSSLFLSHAKLDVIFIPQLIQNQTIDCLNYALNTVKPKTILFTLPSSKSEMIDQNGKNFLGHTEYLRATVNDFSLPMVFHSPQYQILLLTDHIALTQVPLTLNEDYIINKMVTAIKGHKKHFKQLKKIIFSGINPHAGEDSLLGNEELILKKAIVKLKKLYPNVTFLGPIPADTLLFHPEINSSSIEELLLVYTYHDQGLAPFKSLSGFYGVNITLGLPYLRISVDHGTAFSLYGQNKASFIGCYYALKKSLNL